MPTVHFFDAFGNLEENARADERTFNIKLTRTDEPMLMGFHQYTIEGTPEDIQKFLKYYDIELDPPE